MSLNNTNKTFCLLADMRLEVTRNKLSLDPYKMTSNLNDHMFAKLSS